MCMIVRFYVLQVAVQQLNIAELNIVLNIVFNIVQNTFQGLQSFVSRVNLPITL
jgi:hypothetical protein